MDSRRAASPVSKAWNETTISGLFVSVVVPLYFLVISWLLVIYVVPLYPPGIVELVSILPMLLCVALFAYLLNDLVLKKISVVVTEFGVYRSTHFGARIGIEWSKVKRVTLGETWCVRDEAVSLMLEPPQVVVAADDKELAFHRCLFYDDYSLLLFLRKHVPEGIIIDSTLWDPYISRESPPDTLDENHRSVYRHTRKYRMWRDILGFAGSCVLLASCLALVWIVPLPRSRGGDFCRNLGVVVSGPVFLLILVFMSAIIRRLVWNRVRQEHPGNPRQATN